MRIRYLGHAAFYLEPEQGPSIITDPYRPGCYNGALALGAITERAEVALVSHEHDDHCAADVLPGSPTVLTGAGAVGGVEFRVVPAEHDERGGAERGANRIFCFTLDGLRVCHLGDLGHVPTPTQVAAIGETDLLFVPVGGHFTIDAQGAARTVAALSPKAVIPMHYKVPKVDFPIAPVDDFLRLQKNVERVGGSEMTIARDSLPRETTVYVLEPAYG